MPSESWRGRTQARTVPGSLNGTPSPPCSAGSTHRSPSTLEIGHVPLHLALVNDATATGRVVDGDTHEITQELDDVQRTGTARRLSGGPDVVERVRSSIAAR